VTHPLPELEDFRELSRDNKRLAGLLGMALLRWPEGMGVSQEDVSGFDAAVKPDFTVTIPNNEVAVLYPVEAGS
jgi:hypothetical protein